MFEGYTETLDNSDIRQVKYYIKEKGNIENAIKFYFKYIDCTKIYEDGSRPIQTINYSYRVNLSIIITLINELQKEDDNKAKEYLNKLKDIHRENLNFEILNPPVVYSKKRTVKRTSRVSKSKDMFTGETIDVSTSTAKAVKHRENAKTRKAKAIEAKNIKFAFNQFNIK